ncbi:MAG: ABC transporter ATP-binding protein [Chlamydiales bacterium]
MTLKSPVINCQDLNFSYGDFPIIRSANFSIAEKQYVGIIGPNGGGKTTLLKLILGFLTPKSGKLLVLGRPPKESSSRVAYVPQNLAIDRQFPLSVMELVLMGRLSHLSWFGRFNSEDRDRAMESLEKMGIGHLSGRSFGTLSTGQAQRALIARALVSDPLLLLLDEPTANVDAESEAEIHRILKELKESMTILMVSHDLDTMIHDVDRILCVQFSIKELAPEQVCAHFAYGLYHPPLLKAETESNA